MPRLIHLNGPPGAGKSTLAARYAGAHPPTLCCEVDVLRSMIGGWREDFDGAGALVRPASFAFVAAYLDGGHDVVVPQLVARSTELARFAASATEAGHTFLHVLLEVGPDEAVRRFHARTGAWADDARAIVAGSGGDDALRAWPERLDVVRREWPATVTVEANDDVDSTYERFLAALPH